MKICYIAHAIGGDVPQNLADLRRIIRLINSTEPDIVPFCPYYADVVSLDDNIPEERKRGIENDQAILRSGIVDELWLTGVKFSPGMQAEVLIAQEMGIPIRNKIGEL